MRIVHLASSGEIGGAERVLLDILGGLQDSEPHWSHEVIVPRAGSLADQARGAGIHVTVLPWPDRIARLGDAMATRRDTLSLAVRAARGAPDLVGWLRRLRRVIAVSRPTIVHAHGFKMQLAALATRPPRVPVVLHLHDYVSRRMLMSRVLRLVRPRSVHTAAISNSVADDAHKVFGERIPVSVVHNGIDVDSWNPDGPSLDLDMVSGLSPAPAGTVRVGLVATMARWKGHEVFLRALARLPRHVPVRGYVVGGSIYQTDGSQYDISELRDLARELGLGEVGFTGYVDDAAAAMRALDIVVHASTRPEPFGLVIIEAMALQRAVIVSAAGGAVELFRDGETAFSVPPGDPVALAGRIVELVRDPDRRRAAGTAARTSIASRFPRHAMSRGVASVYRSILGSVAARVDATGDSSTVANR